MPSSNITGKKRLARSELEDEEQSFINHDGQGDQYEDDTDEEEQAEFEDALSEEIEEHQRGNKKKRTKSRSHSQSNEPRIRKKKRRNVSLSASDDDTAPKRKPLSQSFHHNRQQQRLDNHPMAITKETTRQGRSKRSQEEMDHDDEDVEDDATISASEQQMQDQIAELQEEAKRLKKRAKLAATVGSRSASKGRQLSAMSREVCKKTKTDLWPVKKFFYNDAKLIDGTKFILRRLGHLVEFDNLRGDAKIDAEELWLVTHKDDVRVSLNDVRNYIQQGLRDFVFQCYENGEEGLLPTVAEILKLMERKGLSSGANKGAMEVKLDFYWDRLMPKVAGHVNWCPTKRHYSLLSTATTPSPVMGEPDIPCVHHSSEAFLVAIWEHCLPKWTYQCVQKRAKEPVDPKHKDMKGKAYITSTGGRKQFGGWTKVGRDRVKALSALCKTARKKSTVFEIENEALKRLRILHKRDAIDQKRKKPKKTTTAVEEEEEEDSDMEEWL